MHHFLSSFFRNAIKSFTFHKGIPHIIAICGTAFFVVSDFDWFYFTHMRSEIMDRIFFPAIVIGGFLPIFVPAILIPFGLYVKNKKITLIGFALAQAAALGSCISSSYKFFTGRIQPDLHDITTNISHGFNFGINEHGVFWGWPSSHTTIAFAMACTLITLFPFNKKVHAIVLAYAFYIGIGISFSIHWFSEFFAGAIIGSVIGIIVGTSFRYAEEKSGHTV